jgi:hypothetical protein
LIILNALTVKIIDCGSKSLDLSHNRFILGDAKTLTSVQHNIEILGRRIELEWLGEIYLKAIDSSGRGP